MKWIAALTIVLALVTCAGPSAGFLPTTTAERIGQPVGVAEGSDGALIVLHRGFTKNADGFIAEDVIAFVDPRNGTILNSWGAGRFRTTHGLHVDPTGNVWITDIGSHQVFRFTPAGAPLLTLGRADDPGTAPGQFDQPTDVAVTDDGTIFVTDGYGNRRVVKFTAAGEYVTDWGREGSDPGEFLNPHAITISENGQLIVSDRDNHRIQRFTQDGRLVAIHTTPAPVYATLPLTDSTFLFTDYLTRDTVIIGSEVTRIDGETTPVLTRPSLNAASPCRYHDLLVKDGYVYLPDLLSKKVHRYPLPTTRR